MRHLLLTLIATMLMAAGARAQLLTLKSDGVLDLAMVPNLGVEVTVTGHSTLGVSVYGSKNIYGQKVVLMGAIPEWRYWLQGTPLDRMFVGAAAMGVHYDINTAGEKWKGDAAGFGLTFGYGFPITKNHWTAEVHAGVALVAYKHNHKWDTDYIASPFINQKGVIFMPFRVGCTVCYVWRYKGEVDSKKNTSKTVAAVNAVQPLEKAEDAAPTAPETAAEGVEQ